MLQHLLKDSIREIPGAYLIYPILLLTTLYTHLK